MEIAVIGKGLIGGSLEKAALRAGHTVTVSDKGEKPRVENADVVFIAVPPSAVVPVAEAVFPCLKTGAVAVDVTGVKGVIYEALSKYAGEKRFSFVGGHPMAGKEKTGYANSCAELFDGASMILTPYPSVSPAVLDMLGRLFAELGFAKVVCTDPAHHDEMIAYTSQLCHLISAAYVRDGLAREHEGYSSGSFRDMVRVGAPDPDVWTELFFANRKALLDTLDAYIGRLGAFRDALASGDEERMRRELSESVAAKAAFGKGLK